MSQPILNLYNTLTREKQQFKPIDANNVGMYVCGITPYDDSHIGHARAYVVFDVLFRLLRHLYGKDHVTYVRNFTDIADEIIKRANENGEEPTALAERHIQSFYADMDALNVLRPTIEPRVSTHLAGMVSMIDELIAAGYGYVTSSGDVMYRTRKFPRFGELARRKLDEQQHGSRVKQDDEKESPNDFVLWKANAKSATKLEQAFNPDDYQAQYFHALGRPGWHIECSVMSKQHLGPTFDIHGGGEDLQFPHHCCEIAQSEALLAPGQNMANYWLHNGFITVGGTKMSKSLGNFTTIKDALAKYSPEAIRLWLLQTHYRKPVDYSDMALIAASSTIEGITESLMRISIQIRDAVEKPLREEVSNQILKIYNVFEESLCDDLNTSRALSQIFEMLSFVRKNPDLVKQELREIDTVLERMFKILGIKITSKAVIGLHSLLQDLLDKREQARAAKDWRAADQLRDALKAAGILVEDGPEGQTWRRL